MQFPAIKTFDSSATPVDGHAVAAPKGAAELDLTEIRAALADAVREAMENDPKLLRAEIGRLAHELSKAQKRAAERDIAAEIKGRAPDLSHLRARLAEAERVHSNIVAALRAGIITPTTKAELEAAEAECAAAQEALARAKAYQPAMLVPRLRERWKALVNELETKELTHLRGTLTGLIGESVVVREKEGAIYAELPGSLLAIAASRFVAGVGSGGVIRSPDTEWNPVQILLRPARLNP